MCVRDMNRFGGRSILYIRVLYVDFLNRVFACAFDCWTKTIYETQRPKSMLSSMTQSVPFKYEEHSLHMHLITLLLLCNVIIITLPHA